MYFVMDKTKTKKRCAYCRKDKLLSDFTVRSDIKCSNCNNYFKILVSDAFCKYAQNMYRGCKINTKRLNIEFTIALEDVYFKYNSQFGLCACTGELMTVEKKHKNSFSIKRIDRLKDYTVDNIELVCKKVYLFENFIDDNQVSSFYNKLTNRENNIIKSSLPLIDEDNKQTFYSNNNMEFCAYIKYLHNYYLELKLKFNLDFNVTLDDVHAKYEEQKGLCAYTSKFMSIKQDKEHIVNIDRLEIIRIDTTKPFTKNNIELVCNCILYVKKFVSNEDILLICRKKLFK